jgi:hypothetical protein
LLCPAALVCLALALCGCGELIRLGPQREYAPETSAAAGGAGGLGGGGEGGGPSTSCAPGGRVLWAKRFGDAAFQYGGATAADAEGGVFVTGVFGGELDFGAGPMQSVGNLDYFLARFDAAGHPLWSRRFGDAAAQDAPVTVARTGDGGVVFAGCFEGSIDFGDGLRTANGVAAFAACYDAGGAHRWTRILDGPGRQCALSVTAAAGSSGAIYMAGFFEDTMTVGSQMHSSAGATDAFLVKLHGVTGEPLWTGAFGGALDDAGDGVGVDSQGRIAFGGATRSGVDLGLGHLTAASDADLFVALYQPSLTPIWTRIYGGPGVQDLRHLAIHPTSGDVFITGLLAGSVDFGQGVLSSSGAFLARLDVGDGDGIASKAVDNFGTPKSLATDSQGNLLVTGLCFGSLDFGSGPMFCEGSQDGAVAKLDPLLMPIYALRIGSHSEDGVGGVSVDPQGNAFVAAAFRDTVIFDGCEPLTSAGDADMLLMKLAP